MTKENQIKTSPSLSKKKDEVLLMNIGGRTATKIQQCIKAIAEEVVNSGVVHFKNICGGVSFPKNSYG